MLSSGIGHAQEKDTLLFIPKAKYQSALMISKTDSINKLKKQAVLTAKNSKELSERMAELDAVLEKYKKKALAAAKANSSDSLKLDATKAERVKAQQEAQRIARLQASKRRTDSIQLAKAKDAANRIAKLQRDAKRIAENKLRLRLRNDSIKTAKAQRLARNRADSLRISRRFQKEKFRQDSIRVAQAQIAAERLAKRKQDSINTVIAAQKAAYRADSTRVAQAKIATEQLAKRKQDSINRAISQQKAAFRADSIRVAQATIAAEQLAKRKQDSINTAIAQQKATFRADSIRVAQATIAAEQLTKRKQDSINTVITKQKAAFRADSIRVAQATIAAEQLAKRKQDSVNTVIAEQKAGFRADSIRVAQANIIAEQLAKRKQDSVNTVIAEQKATFKADSIRVAQANIIAEKLAKRKQDSIITVIAEQKATFRADSIRVAQAQIAAKQLSKRKQDSINTVIAEQKATFRADSVRVAQAQIAAKQLAKRKQDSITTAITAQRAQFKADSIRVAQAQVVAEQFAKRKQDSINTAIAQQKARFKADSVTVAGAKLVAKQLAERKQDSINTILAAQRAQFKADSIGVAQAQIVAEQFAKRKQDSINTAISQQKARFKADSIQLVNTRIANQLAGQRQDSINKAFVAEQQALIKADSLQATRARVAAEELAQRKENAIAIAIARQKERFQQDSIEIAGIQAANRRAKRTQDSIQRLAAIQKEAEYRADANRRVQQKIAAEQEAFRKEDSIANEASINTLYANLKTQDSLRLVKKEAYKSGMNGILNDSLDQATIANNTVIRNAKRMDTLPFIRNGNLLSKFVKGNIELQQGQIVSNVLKVVNIGKNPIRFTTDLLIPGSWTRIDDPEKMYIAKQNDTVIVPIIISPTKLVNGNTEVIINSFLIGEQQQQLANNYFSLRTKKEVSWDIELTDTRNMYLKNGEDNRRFKFYVHNSGNYKQDLFVNFSIPRKDLFLADTLGNKLKQPNYTFSLEANQRKEFDYQVFFKNLNKRNFRRVSFDSYNPNTVVAKKTHRLIINSNEPRLGANNFKKRTRVNFIKLPNEVKANPYGYPYFPLTLRMSAQNILDDRSFLAISLRGFKQFNATSSLMYSTDINYSNSYFTKNILNNAPWYVGYYDEKKSIEVGQINGGLMGIAASGKGIKGSYRINNQHEVGAFYTNSGGFASARSSISIGGWHKYLFNEDVQIKTQLGRNINSISNRSINVLSIQPSLRLKKKHNIAFVSSFTNKKQQNAPANVKANGLLIGSSFSTRFFKKRLGFNFSARYNDKNFGFGNFDRFAANNRLTYTLNNGWNIFLSNNYQESSNYDAVTGLKNYTQASFFNNIVMNSAGTSGNYQYGLFYEYRNSFNSIINNRGVTFRYSNFNFLKNLINSFFIRAGYTRPEMNNETNKDYFNLQLSSLSRFRTWSFNTQYNLGAFSTLTSQQTLNDFTTPQSFRFSAQNQYLFPSRKVLIESSAIYSYNNVFSNHTLGLFPTIYYFNNSGWRFGMSANYNFSTSDYSSVFDNLNNQQGGQFNRLNETTTSNFNLNFSLKKDFGIPIPFVEKTAATGNFVAFLDLNGDGIKDENETTLENVVIKIGKKEVLTNIDGEATIKNVLKDEYDFEVFSLEELNGWFPNVTETILMENSEIKYIPFVRGIKLYGDVVLDRQKIAVANDKPTDLSRIKITATTGDKIYSALTNNAGRFEFYLPYGDYTITMDEAILNGGLNLTRNNIPLKLNSTQDGVYVSFYIIEKRRKVIFRDFSKKKN